MQFKNKISGLSIIELMVFLSIAAVVNAALFITYKRSNDVLATQKEISDIESLYSHLNSMLRNPEILAASIKTNPTIFRCVATQENKCEMVKDKYYGLNLYQGNKSIINLTSSSVRISGIPENPVYYTANAVRCSESKLVNSQSKVKCNIKVYTEVKLVTCKNNEPAPCDRSASNIAVYLTMEDTSKTVANGSSNSYLTLKTNKPTAMNLADMAILQNTCGLVQSMKCEGAECNTLRYEYMKDCDRNMYISPIPSPVPSVTALPTVVPTPTPVGTSGSPTPTPVGTSGSPTPTPVGTFGTPVPIPTSTSTSTITENFVQGSNQKIDILFVLDSSSTMSSYISGILSGLTSFTNALKTYNADYHIGITGSQRSNSSGTLYNGTFLTPASTNYSSVFAVQPVDHEEFLITFATSALNSFSGVNQSFFRPNAILNIIFITDTEEQVLKDGNFRYSFSGYNYEGMAASPGSLSGGGYNIASSFYSSALNKVGSIPGNTGLGKVKIHSITQPCGQTSRCGSAYQQASVLSGVSNYRGNINSNNWSSYLVTIANQSVLNNYVKLTGIVNNLSSIVVKVNEVIINSSTYSYNSSNKTITFNSSIPSLGSSISVTYN